MWWHSFTLWNRHNRLKTHCSQVMLPQPEELRCGIIRCIDALESVAYSLSDEHAGFISKLIH